MVHGLMNARRAVKKAKAGGDPDLLLAARVDVDAVKVVLGGGSGGMTVALTTAGIERSTLPALRGITHSIRITECADAISSC